MASILLYVNSILFSPSFWFPPNVTWEHFQNKPENATMYFPQTLDLSISVLLGVLFVVLRLGYETIILKPIAMKLGIKIKRKRAEENPYLELCYEQHKGKFSEDVMKTAVKNTDWNRRKIERWLRIRSQQDKDTIFSKFCDCGFHFLAYTIASIYGVAVLWDKQWFGKTTECWTNWPYHHVPRDIYWYYQGELGLYWCLVFSVVRDHRRKDFAENVVHHVCTMLLVTFSWIANFVRIGTLILLIHDVVDPWLALAKMVKYAKYERVCLCLFVVFTIIWIITRLCAYPFVALYSVVYEVMPYMYKVPAYALFFFLLHLLLVLHLMWTYMIFRIIIRNLQQGAVEDIRSDSDDAEDISSISDQSDGKEHRD